MKKLLIVALAVAFAVVLMKPAMAATDFQFKGNFYTWIYSLQNVGAMKADDDHNRTLNFMWLKAKLTFTAYVSKTLYFQGTFTGLDKKWGRNLKYYNETTYPALGTTSASAYKNNEALWREASVTLLTSPVGYFRVGQYRTDPDPIMGKLGTSPVGADRYFAQTDSDVVRFIWAYSFVPMHTFIFLYEKVYEIDSEAVRINRPATVFPDHNWDYDHDYNVYYTRNDFRWKGGEFRLVAEWDKFQTWGGSPAAGVAPTTQYEIRGNKYIFSGNLNQSFGPFTFWLYGQMVFGSLEYLLYPTGDESPLLNGGEGRHYRIFQYAGTAEYKKGPIQTGVGYYFLPGQQRNDDETIDFDADITTGGGTGDWFMPLYAAFGEYDGLLWKYTMDWAGLGSIPTSATTSMDLSKMIGSDGLAQGLRLYYAWFDYQLLENLWLHAAAGYMMRDIEIEDISKFYGSEIDFGVAWTPIKGMELQFHFGYFMPGDNLKDTYMYLYPTRVEPEYAAHIHGDIMFVVRY